MLRLFLEQADNILRDLVQTITGPITVDTSVNTDLTAGLIALPRQLGGLGFVPHLTIQPGAFLGSVIQLVQNVDLLPVAMRRILSATPATCPQPSTYATVINDTVACFHAACAHMQSVDTPLPRSVDEILNNINFKSLKHPQAWLNTHLHAANRALFEERCMPSDDSLESLALKSRLRSLRLPGASEALEALPVDHDSTMTNDEFRTMIQHRLCMHISAIPANIIGQHCCTHRGRVRNVSAYHLQTCPRNGDITRRHTNEVNTVSALLEAVGIKNKIEPRTFGDNNNEGPDVITTYSQLNGKQYALDLTNVHVEQNANNNLRHAADNDYFFSDARQHAKHQHYDQYLRARNITLLTLCFESTGAFSTEFQAFWTAFAGHVKRLDDEDMPIWPRTFLTPNFTAYAKKRLACVHAKWMHRIISRRLQAVVEGERATRRR